MIAGGNWWRANEIVIRHLTRQTATRYRCRERAGGTLAGELPPSVNYLGIDASERAIEAAQSLWGGDDILFKAHDIREFDPVGDWDAIVFSEVLAYLAVHEAIAEVRAIPRRFHPNGERALRVDSAEEPCSRTRVRAWRRRSVLGEMSPFALCGEDRRRERDELRQFPQILGGGGQQELIFGSARPAHAQSVEPENALETSKQHLNLPSLTTRDGVGLGLGRSREPQLLRAYPQLFVLALTQRLLHRHRQSAAPGRMVTGGEKGEPRCFGGCHDAVRGSNA
jgi:hypothetical protein